MYPNSSQKVIIEKTFGCVRKVYNHYLCVYLNKHNINISEIIKDYTSNYRKKFLFLLSADDYAIKKSIYRVYDTITKYYKGSIGLPKFKGKYNRQSFTIKDVRLDNNRTVYSPSLSAVKIRGYKAQIFTSLNIISATISKEQTGKYYISLLVRNSDIFVKNNIESVVGIDLGVKTLISTSDGIEYKNNKYMEKYEKKINRLNSEMSNKSPGGKNYIKLKCKLYKYYSKLANARKYYINKITKEIVTNHDLIITESINVKSMTETPYKDINKSILDATPAEIIRQLKYKCQKYGKLFYQVAPNFPSSQLCSSCGFVDKSMKSLDKRTYVCSNCGLTLDRDINASINIMLEGIEKNFKKISALDVL